MREGLCSSVLELKLNWAKHVLMQACSIFLAQHSLLAIKQYVSVFSVSRMSQYWCVCNRIRELY